MEDLLRPQWLIDFADNIIARTLNQRGMTEEQLRGHVTRQRALFLQEYARPLQDLAAKILIIPLDLACRAATELESRNLVTPAGETRRLEPVLRARHYNSREIEAGSSRMKDGQRISSVEWFRWVLDDGTVISRESMRTVLRPPGVSSENYAAQFEPVAQLEALERDHRRSVEVNGA